MYIYIKSALSVCSCFLILIYYYLWSRIWSTPTFCGCVCLCFRILIYEYICSRIWSTPTFCGCMTVRVRVRVSWCSYYSYHVLAYMQSHLTHPNILRLYDCVCVFPHTHKLSIYAVTFEAPEHSAAIRLLLWPVKGLPYSWIRCSWRGDIYVTCVRVFVWL